MATSTPAEEMPALYRAILDRVAELELAGLREEAARVRRDATATYSRAWDEGARRRLASLLRAADRPTSVERRLGRGIPRAFSRSRAGRLPPRVLPEP